MSMEVVVIRLLVSVQISKRLGNLVHQLMFRVKNSDFLMEKTRKKKTFSKFSLSFL